MPRRPLPLTALLLGLGLFAGLLAEGCGRRTPVKPREDLRPAPIGNLTATVAEGGVLLEWSRPTENVDGSRLDELGHFVIERRVPGGNGFDQRFRPVAEVPVTDRERFRKVRQFRHLDPSDPAAGPEYRVVSHTLDGYTSAPSNMATPVRRPDSEDTE